MRTPLDAIHIGDRRREDLGDIPSLARSIQRYGLLHPIVLDDANNLIAGGRRLEACRRLGWSEVETRSMGELDEAERVALELEENIRRKDLTSYEQSKEMLRRAEQAEVALAARVKGQAPDFLDNTSKKSAMGRPPLEVPKEHIAEALGTSRTSVRRAEQHAAAVEEFPDLRALPQHTALREARARRGPATASASKRQRRPMRPRAQGSPAALWLKTLKDFRDRWEAMGGQAGLLAVCAPWSGDDTAGLSRELAEWGRRLHDAAQALSAREEHPGDRAS